MPPDPLELLAVARLLAGHDEPAPPNDARLRRAASTAYYALFHKLLLTAARRFMGADGERTAGFALIYRGYDHRQVKSICEVIQASTLKERYKRYLGRDAVSRDMRDFAGALPELQDTRHRADYDPSARFSPADVASLIDTAAFAMESFERAAPDEQADVLALMLVGARG